MMKIVVASIPYNVALEKCITKKIKHSSSICDLVELENDAYINLFGNKENEYACLMPIEFVEIMEGEEYKEIKGFECRGNTNKFYKLDGFNNNMDEIIGDYVGEFTSYRWYKIG